MKTILLAHNDPAVLERLTPRLSDLGYDVVASARTAGAALAMAAQADIAFALVGDVLSGRRHGRELRRALRETWGTRCARLPRDGAGDVLAALRVAR